MGIFRSVLRGPRYYILFGIQYHNPMRCYLRLAQVSSLGALDIGRTILSSVLSRMNRLAIT